MSKYHVKESEVTENWGWLKSSDDRTVGMGNPELLSWAMQMVENEAERYEETIAAKDARIAKLENELLGKDNKIVEVTRDRDEWRESCKMANKRFQSNDASAKEAILLRKKVAELEAQLAELTAPKPVETFEPETLTGSFSSYWEGFIDPYGTVIVFYFHYDGGYEQVIVLPDAWEENKEVLEASIGKEITIKATWQDDELEFIFDSIVSGESAK